MTDLNKVNFERIISIMHDVISGKRHIDKPAKDAMEEAIELLKSLETIWIINKHLRGNE